MNRRESLGRIVGTAGALTVTPLAGCLSDDESDDPENTSGMERNEPSDEEKDGGETWRKEYYGTVDAVRDGLVIGREANLPPVGAEARLFALDVTTGERAWTSDESGGMNKFVPSGVDDAIYTAWGSDEIGAEVGEVHAFEFDGTKRWTTATAGVYDGPLVADGAVYVGCDDGSVRSLRTSDGERRWKTDVVDTEDAWPVPEIVSVEGAVFVATESLLALDAQTGDRLWRYKAMDVEDGDAMFSDGVAYLTDAEDVVAVAGGDTRWRRTIGGAPDIRAIVSNRLLLTREQEVIALAADTGEEKWRMEFSSQSHIAVSSAGDVWMNERRNEILHAVDPIDGSERWQTAIDSGAIVTIRSIPTAEGNLDLVHQSSQVHTVTGDGRIVGSASVPRGARPVLADRTDRAVFQIEREVGAVQLA